MIRSRSSPVFRGLARKRSAATSASAATHDSRSTIAERSAASRPIAAASAIIRTHSRTPRPPGSTATAKPAVVASATPAITVGQSRHETNPGATASMAAAWLSPSKAQPATDQSIPSPSSRREARGIASAPTPGNGVLTAAASLGNTRGVVRVRNASPRPRLAPIADHGPPPTAKPAAPIRPPQAIITSVS